MSGYQKCCRFEGLFRRDQADRYCPGHVILTYHCAAHCTDCHKNFCGCFQLHCCCPSDEEEEILESNSASEADDLEE